MAEPIIIVRENGLVVQVEVVGGTSGPCTIEVVENDTIILNWKEADYTHDHRKYKEKRRNNQNKEVEISREQSASRSRKRGKKKSKKR
jgi:hypothetical protein